MLCAAQNYTGCTPYANQELISGSFAGISRPGHCIASGMVGSTLVKQSLGTELLSGAVPAAANSKHSTYSCLTWVARVGHCRPSGAQRQNKSSVGALRKSYGYLVIEVLVQ